MANKAGNENKKNSSKLENSKHNSYSGSAELVLILFYLAVEFIPQMGSIEIMGPQWLYLSILNLISILFITVKHKTTFKKLLDLLSKNILSLLFVSWFAWCGFSIFFALNPTESIVVYSRLTTVLISFFSIGTLIYFYPKNLSKIFQIISIACLIQCIYLIKYYLQNIDTVQLDTLILQMGANAGNKNVLAASLVIKAPVIIYCVFKYFSWWRYALNIFSLILITLTIILLNARAAYLGFFIQIILFTVFLLFSKRQNGIKKTVRYFLTILIPIVIGVSVSQILLTLKDENVSKGNYGTIDTRLATLSDHSESSSSARLFFWKNALKQIKETPIIGCGFGNWKIVSVKYEYGFYDDFNYSKHAHNDFLQVAAESGILAGLLFLSLFLLALIYTIKVFTSEASSEYKLLSAISLMALAGYFTDANFNFPMERPVMQAFFAFFIAVNVVIHFIALPLEKRKPLKYNFSFIMLVAGTTLGIASTYISWQTYQSMRVQILTHFNFGTAQPGVTWMDVNPRFPAIPNLAENNIPINDIKAWYLFRAQKFDEALYLLDQDKNANPYSMSKEWLKASIYTSQSRIDSAHYYSKKGFFIRPRNLSLFNIVTRTSVPLKDTTTIQRAFKEYRKYRDEPNAWRIYMRSLFAVHYDRTELLQLADSLVKVYPNDNQILHTRYFIRAGFAGMNKKFPEALENLLGIMKLLPGDYENIENIGLTYYFMKEYESSASYFKKVVDAKVYGNGKSEFYLGNCLLLLKRKEEACKYLYISANRNYPGGSILFNKNNCSLNTQKQ